MHKVVERQTFSQLPKLDLDFIIEAERGLDGRLDEKGTPEVVHDHPVELLEVDSLRRHLVDDGQPLLRILLQGVTRESERALVAAKLKQVAHLLRAEGRSVRHQRLFQQVFRIAQAPR